MTAEGDFRALFDLSGRTAALTGAASGIARGIALTMAELGCHVILIDINAEGLRAAEAEIRDTGGSVESSVTDASDPHAVETLFERLDASGTEVDVLVNAAFAHRRAAPEDLSYPDWLTCVEVSLGSYFLCAQAVGRRMIQSGRGGSIVNISSIAATSGIGRGNIAYSSAKGGVNALTRELAVEWAQYGIRVNAIQPCQVRTPAIETWLGDPTPANQALVKHLVGGIPLGRLARVDDIVGPAIFLASDAAAMVTGVCLPVDGGNLALNAAGGDPR